MSGSCQQHLEMSDRREQDDNILLNCDKEHGLMQMGYGVIELDCDEDEVASRGAMEYGQVEYGVIELESHKDNEIGWDGMEWSVIDSDQYADHGEMQLTITTAEDEYGIVALNDEEDVMEGKNGKQKSTHTCCMYKCIDHYSPAEVQQLLTLFTSKSLQELLLDQILLSGVSELAFSEATLYVSRQLTKSLASLKLA